jgi:ATP-dependent helicase Lhr and Lhr-like helicase
MSAFDRLSGALQYPIVNALGFRELRPVQLETIDALLEGKNAVVLAPTAGGKTEAAFFPLLSLMDTDDWRPVSVLYLSPIRALLNNQEARIQKYAGLIGRRAFKWHGDTAQGPRKRFIKDPADILLITPESLEAMLMSSRVPARALFAGLRAVIIDEVHAFADDDRGAHLSALLERLTRFCGRDLQRVGLSATVGNPDEILHWLQGSSERPSTIVNPGGARALPDLSLDYVGSLENAALMVERLHPGKKRLVFVDSRRKAEQLGSALTARGVLTYVMHGSLSAAQRRDAESAFEQGSDCAIVATSAMELGIDIGDLDHVLQIDSPASVASFLQRMGRTGRRGGAPNCTFLTLEDNTALHAAALLHLYRTGYVEPVRPSRQAFHILAHQAMALAVQFGGVARGDWFQWVAGATAFADLSPADRDALMERMLSESILADQGGKLWLGPVGERRFGAANFRQLYAVFDAPRLITVVAGTEEVGSVDAQFLATLMEGGKDPAFTLGARAWQVVHLDWERGVCAVKPAPTGKAPRWSGSGTFLGFELCQAMRALLLSTDADPAWSKRFLTTIESLRAQYTFLEDSPLALLPRGPDHEWWTFAGGAANVLLSRVLEGEFGEKITSNNLKLTFKEGAAQSPVAIRQAIEHLARDGRPTDEEALIHAQGAGRTRFSKFDRCLTEEQLLRLLRERVVDAEGARRALALSAG